MVCALKAFEDEPKSCNEAILEAIQMAWLAEYEDADE
jgi:FeS assembly protein IscX